ncbi:sugar ABC transporter permease [Vallitalea sediminicola]
MLSTYNKRKLVKKIEPFLYLLPAIVFFGLFTYYPFLKTVFNSFFLIDSMGKIKEFIGLENFINVLTNQAFLKSIGNTFVFVFLSVPTSIGIALLLALIANKKTRTSSIYELLFSLTMAMSMSVCAMIFQLMYNPSIGIINHLLSADINWLNDKSYALISIVIIQVWMTIGYNFLFLLSAIRGVPTDLLESASIEGANIFKKTTKIIIPIISPTVFFLVCNAVAKNMVMSGLTIILTEGGPQGSTETMISFMYKQAMNNQNYNDAYAAAIVAFIITFIMILISFTFEKKGVHYS